jgi:hypothetical protein
MREARGWKEGKVTRVGVGGGGRKKAVERVKMRKKKGERKKKALDKE